MKRSFRFFKPLLIFTFFTLTLNQDVNAQESEYKDNSIFLSYGTVIFYNQLSISAERTIFEDEIVRYKVKLNYGNYSENNLDLSTGERIYNKYYGASGVFLFGLFEFSLGAARVEYTLAEGISPVLGVDYDKVLNSFILQGNTGIRFEKNEMLLRAGVGSRELIYVGFGFNF